MGTKYLGAKFEVTDDLDVNGTTQLDGTLTVGVDDTGHDVKFFGDTSGKYMEWDASANQLQLQNAHLRMDNTGGNAIIKCDTGNLKIQVNEADHDLLLQSDDGSGSIATYIKLKGNTTQTFFAKETVHNDDVKGTFGDSGDLQIYHNGSNSQIDNTTGHLQIRNFANDSDIIFETDDGSGGSTAYLTLDGSAEKVISAKQFQADAGIELTGNLNAPDNSRIRLGSSTDLQIVHTGSDSYIHNTTNTNLYLKQSGVDKDIIFLADDGSGSETEYFRLDGGDERTIFSKHTKHLDNAFFAVGTGGDFTKLYG
jgi:hypothetical protein